MRPTLSEQIEGARRVLVELAAPEVSDSFAREQITHAAAALEHVATRWPEVLPDLVADIRALEELLGVEPAALGEAVPGVPDLDRRRGVPPGAAGSGSPTRSRPPSNHRPRCGPTCPIPSKG